MTQLGAKAITALVVPEPDVAHRILALNTEKAHNLKEKSLEVSRLALSSSVRRCHAGGATGASSPFLATAMFYAVSSLVVTRGVENVFMVIEPSLGRLTSRFGIKLDQISRPFEYYGQRATFATTGQRMGAESRQLKRPWRDLFDVVESQLYAELTTQVQVA